MEAYDRKLRAVYDAVDCRNYKGAIKQCNSLLGKYKNDQRLRALKALSLTRIGGEAEANQICDGLVNEAMEDEPALTLTSMVLQHLNRQVDVVALHLKALSVNPSNAILLRATFGAYARVGNLVEQQKLAMKLSKADPVNERVYAWWLIVVLYLQSFAEDTGVGNRINKQQALKLAQALAEKRFSKFGAEEGFEAMSVYIQILLDQGNVANALEILSGPAGNSIQIEDQKLLWRAELMNKLGIWEESSDMTKSLWSKSPADWKSFNLLLRALLPGAYKLGKLPEGGKEPVNQVGKADEVISQVEKEAITKNDSSEIRGCSLASVELEYRRQMLSSAGGEASSSGRIDSEENVKLLFPRAIYSSFQKLGGTLSCFSDLRSYLEKLDSNQVEWLHNKMDDEQIFKEIALKDLQDGPLTLAQACQKISALQVQRHLGYPKFPDPEAAFKHAKTLVDLYYSCQHLYEGVDDKDRGPADELIELAVQYIIIAWALDPIHSPKYLLQAVILLDSIQRKRKVSAYLRLAASSLYSILGAPNLAHAELKELQIKHIQHATISGQMTLPPLISGLCHKELDTELKSMSKFFGRHMQNYGDSIMTALEAGNYSKVPEFFRFRENLMRSATRVTSFLETNEARLEMAFQQNAKTFPIVAQELEPNAAFLTESLEKDGFEGLRFHEDLRLRPSWFPPSTCLPSFSIIDWWQAVENKTLSGKFFTSPTKTMKADDKSPEAEQYRAARFRAFLIQSLNIELLILSFTLDKTKLPKFEALLERLNHLQSQSNEGRKASGKFISGNGNINNDKTLTLSKMPNQLRLAFYKAVFVSQTAGGDSRGNWNSFSLLAEEFCSELVSTIENDESANKLPIFGPGWFLAAVFLKELVWAFRWLKFSTSRKDFGKLPDGLANKIQEDLRAMATKIKALITLKDKKAETYNLRWMEVLKGDFFVVDSEIVKDKKNKLPVALAQLFGDQLSFLGRIEKLAGFIK